MDETLRIFIGDDSRFPEPAQVMAHSIREHATLPVDISFLKLPELIELGFNRLHDPLATTEFTYSRFLVPWLCKYQGKALFVDNDQLCLGDVRALTELDMGPFALRVVKHDYQPTATTKMYGVPQTVYARKNWSSVMLMDCSKLTCWTKDVVETATGARLHRFQDIPDEQIGDLDKSWNSLDQLLPDRPTNIIHWTSGMLWNDATKPWPHQELWLAARRRWRKAAGLNPDTPVPSQIPGP